jgi:hypothetical protein
VPVAAFLSVVMSSVPSSGAPVSQASTAQQNNPETNTARTAEARPLPGICDMTILLLDDEDTSSMPD